MNTVTTPAAIDPAPRRDAGSAGRIARFIGTRLLLAAITLWILSVIVFAGGQLLPGDVGRAILGPLADARAVAALNHQLGVDRPLFTQYAGWIAHFLRGDMGQSYSYRAPVAPFIGDALLNSAKLGALAFIVVVPLGIGTQREWRLQQPDDRLNAKAGARHICIQPAEDAHQSGIEADFLLGLAQCCGALIGIARIDAAPRKGNLAGMIGQMKRAQGQQDAEAVCIGYQRDQHRRGNQLPVRIESRIEIVVAAFTSGRVRVLRAPQTAAGYSG